jgi:deoxyribonuclease V
MILAVDVDYREGYASAGGILFESWTDEIEKSCVTSTIQEVQDYVPGQFSRRELPCILRLLAEHRLSPSYIVIDGFVYLDGVSRPGLGKYLYDALASKIGIIGVAKTPFKGLTPGCCEIYRGNSKKPLYVTSAGVASQHARQFIRSMHGKFRIPTLLKKADQLCQLKRSEPGKSPEKADPYLKADE